jgi:PAS domain S-box-containing protein
MPRGQIQSFEEQECRLQRGYGWVLAFLWLTTVIISLSWNMHRIKQSTLKTALTHARSSFKKDIIYRRWNAMHGGVYVPITDITPSNPYLSSENRDIVTTTGMRLTLLNPAYMTRQALALQMEESGVQGRIISLQPLRPENQADPWESAALEQFAQGADEVSSVESMKGEPYLRFMRPLMVKDECLQCHAEQGYQVGNVRGGISVAVPLIPLQEIADHNRLSLAFWHMVFLVIGIGGVYCGNKKILRNIEQRKQVEHELELAYGELEQRVENRTKELRQEVEERKKAQVETLRAQKEWERTFDAVPDLITVLNEDHEIIHANRALAEKLNLPMEQIINSKCYRIMHRADSPPSFCPHKKVLEDYQSYSEEFFNKHLDCYLHVIVTPLYDENGVFVGSVHVARDITARKEAETKLRKAEKMEAIGLMAGGVAHDLNNILAAIVGYPDLLLMELPENSDLRQPIEAIRQSGERASEVVADLLTVARGVVAEREPADLTALIQEYIASPERKELQKRYPDVSFTTELAPDLVNINCSSIHLKKCIMNLVGNAAEAIGESGVVTITTRNQHIEEPMPTVGGMTLQAGTYAVVGVRDTGSGIEEKDLQHIFEPFYSKKVMGRSGTGLGLAVVWNSVQDHKGGILVDSSPQGTQFQLFFPASNDILIQEREDTSLESLQGNGETVLVADDEAQQQEIAERMLTLLGYSVHTVQSGEEAVQYMEDNEADLLILDMVMGPGINGRIAYEKIIAMHPGQKTIIVSGFSETEEVRKVKELGVDLFLKKPFRFEELAKAIKQVLQ